MPDPTSTESANTRCTKEIAIEPSPTADATRLTLPHRTSPTANTPGRDVSSRYGERSSGHCAAVRSSRVRSDPVFTKPFPSSVTWLLGLLSQSVFASAPVIRNTCLISWLETAPASSRHVTDSRRPFPARATISVLVLTWIVELSSIRRRRYRDMLSERLFDRTST